MPRRKAGFRLSETVLDLLKSVADRLGVSQAAVIEIAVRRFAETDPEQNSENGKTVTRHSETESV